MPLRIKLYQSEGSEAVVRHVVDGEVQEEIVVGPSEVKALPVWPNAENTYVLVDRELPPVALPTEESAPATEET